MHSREFLEYSQTKRKLLLRFSTDFPHLKLKQKLFRNLNKIIPYEFGNLSYWCFLVFQYNANLSPDDIYMNPILISDMDIRS